jgi:RNA-binding protein YhbY
MWTVVYMAQGKDMATKIQQALEEHGILVKVKPIGKDGSGKDNCYEILVPAAEVEEAHNIIIDIEF